MRLSALAALHRDREHLVLTPLRIRWTVPLRAAFFLPRNEILTKCRSVFQNVLDFSKIFNERNQGYAYCSDYMKIVTVLNCTAKFFV